MVMQCCRSCTIASSIIGLYMSLNKPVCLHSYTLSAAAVLVCHHWQLHPTNNSLHGVTTNLASTHTHARSVPGFAVKVEKAYGQDITATM